MKNELKSSGIESMRSGRPEGALFAPVQTVPLRGDRYAKNRWWTTGASAVCLASMVALIGAGPTTAPVSDAPATSTVAAAPTTAPAAAVPAATVPVTTAAVTTPSRQQQDQSNQNRYDRNNRGNNRGNTRGNRGGGNSGDAITAANAAGDPYVILQQRSIFIKGNQNTTPPSAENRVVPRQTIYNERPANLLIFNGVTVINDKPEAFVEDLGSNVVGTVKIGDGVAGGTVLAINFDDLAYQVRGQTKHVGLGQNFNGDSAFALSAPAAPTTNPASPSAPGQIVGAGASIPAAAAPTASGLSSEDILARMKAKRAQEAQQIGK